MTLKKIMLKVKNLSYNLKYISYNLTNCLKAIHVESYMN